MVKHIVIWRLPDTPDKEKRMQDIKVNLEALKDKIEYIKEIHVGISFNHTEFGSDVVLESVFESKEALEAYLVHPEHKAFGAEYVRPYVSERRVIDYEF